MTAADHTLTFPYGETPAEVIRERFIEGRNVSLKIDGKTQGSGDLLTVLDALRWANWAYDTKGMEQEALDALDLRISILAALGIEEG